MIERLSRRIIGSILLWDIILTVITLFSSAIIRTELEYGNILSKQQVHIPLPLYAIVAIIWATIFWHLAPQRALFFGNLIEMIGRLLGSVALSTLTFAGVIYLSFRDISRLQFLYFATIDLIILLAFHIVVRLWLRMNGHTSRQRRTMIVGSGPESQQLAREFERRPWIGVHIVGYATNDDINDVIPVLGRLYDTPTLARQNNVDEIIFVGIDPKDIANLSIQLVREPVMLHMAPSVLDLAFARMPVETLGGIPLISLRESALTESQRALKRLFDITGSFVLLAIFFPLMLLIALAIKLDSPGPVFFLQERIGEYGRRFKMIKFRSMYRDAEQRWREFVRYQDNGQFNHKHINDPRVTRVGRILRRTSLDELPQLFNVLRGEMSLVGPRPEMPYIALEAYEPWQWQRFRVPPGMTGWWQVNGRSEKPMHLNTQDDLYYIQNYSFWLDLKILWKTVRVVLRGQGAF